jgi:glycogen phosphorylase
MREPANQNFLDMHQAAVQQLDQTFRQDFSLKRELPENLQALDKISNNYFWSWDLEGAALFRDLDSQLWEKYEQNPRRLLKEISDLRLWQKACEPGFVERVNRFAEKLENYLAVKPESFGHITPENPIAYFCAEYGIHNSLPIYSGGLGILAGDHLKSASDMNVPLVAVGLMYRFGYFRQKISHDGWQGRAFLSESTSATATFSRRFGLQKSAEFRFICWIRTFRKIMILTV